MMALVEIRYRNRRGASCMVAVEQAELYQRLTNLRQQGVQRANAYRLDSEGEFQERIGGIEPAPLEGYDDRRIKYQVWCEK